MKEFAMIYFTADQHFGHHNIIKYENRPFKDTKEMDETMILKWNKVVHRNDTVYILGDVTFSKKESDVAAIMEQLKGKKVLIKGNHDYFANKAWTAKYFDHVTDYLEINCKGMKFCLMHYPMATWNKKHHGAIHLHGHIHSNELPFEIGGKILNVGVDLFDYRPVSIDEVIQLTNMMPYEFDSNSDIE
jgi:calcineurin-like phosphoesterase family protein